MANARGCSASRLAEKAQAICVGRQSARSFGGWSFVLDGPDAVVVTVTALATARAASQFANWLARSAQAGSGVSGCAKLRFLA